jgi:hypothetical protein
MKKQILLIVLLLFFVACQNTDKKSENTHIDSSKIADSETKKDTVTRYVEEPVKDTFSPKDRDPDFAQKTLEAQEKTIKDQAVKKYQIDEVKKVNNKETEKNTETPIYQPKKDKYDKVFPFFQGLAVVMSDKKYGYINNKGQEIISPKYDFAEDFSEGGDLVRVRIKDKVGFINRLGQEVIPLKYRYVEKFYRGLAHARLIDGEQFYIDKQGNMVCEILDAYRDGMARVKLGKKIGYVDGQGRLAIPIDYNYGTHFQDGVAEVKKGDKHFFINKKGECVKDCE